MLGVDILRDRTLRDYAVGAYTRTREGHAAGCAGGWPGRADLPGLPRTAHQPAEHRHHREAGEAPWLHAGRRDAAHGRRPHQHLRDSRPAGGQRSGARDGRQLRADGHRGRAVGVCASGTHRPGRRADRTRTHGTRRLARADGRGPRRGGHRHQQALARRPLGRTAVQAWAAGGAHAGGVPHEPVGAVVGGARGGSLPGLQHGHRLGAGSTRRGGDAAGARRHTPPGAVAVSRRGRAPGCGGHGHGAWARPPAGRCGRGRHRRHGEHAVYRHRSRAALS